MLNQFFTDPIALRVAQALTAAIFALIIVFLARTRGIRLEREALVALSRGIVQIITVGILLTYIFSGRAQLSVILLMVMLVAASVIAARRVRNIPNILQVTLGAIFVGAGLVIGVMLFMGVIDPTPTSLIPVGSMIITNAMNTTALALDRFRAEVEAHTGQIEAALALGAAPNVTLTPYVQATVQASMIPSINNLRALGIVRIPGLMAGMLLVGTDPLEAAIYQFVVIAMTFATAGTTSILCTLLVRSRAFSSAEQLTLRPVEK